MGWLIGMDEAGYGPNLGPLVIAVTVWEVAGEPAACDPWTMLENVVTQTPVARDPRLHVADSKEVYSPSQGLRALERTALATAGLMQQAPSSASHWRRLLFSQTGHSPVPWESGDGPALPTVACPLDIAAASSSWREACDSGKIRLHAAEVEIVQPERFNRLTRAADSKGLALSRLSFGLLRRVWNPANEEPTLVVADKHGGRNRYDDLIAEVLDGEMVFARETGRELSCYQVGATELRFQTKAERHFPVAVASILAKYTRELAMDEFNAYWVSHLPGLKPTKGYPNDAKRFRQEIAATQAALRIADDVLWRER